MKSDFEWLVETVPEQLPWLKNQIPNNENLSPQEVTRLWIHWLLKMSFAQLFGLYGDRKGYIIARPVKLGWVFDTSIDYFATIFWYDPQGEVVFIDSLWAPGYYPQVLTALKKTGRPYCAWEHKGKLFFKTVSELSGQIPSKSEINEAYVRPTVIAASLSTHSSHQ